MCALVALMVIVGGATRLTDSGLSIVEWRPVTGAIPPLSEADWLAEFEKYKTIPEYRDVNWGMSLDAFKEIYWWEWGHRFLGRLIGVAFLVPLIFFVATKRVERPMALKLGVIFLLGGAQGVLGWWMVSSGLSERVDVSQYRLAAHLALAVLLFGALFWVALDLATAPVRRAGRATAYARKSPSPVLHGRGARGEGSFSIRGVEATAALAARALTPGPSPARAGEGGRGRFVRWRFASLGLVLLVFIQMILGAFVAGLRAGRTFNTWPLMHGAFFPDGYFAGAPNAADLFETAAAVQFNHRLGAYVLLAAATAFAVAARKTVHAGRAKILLGAVALQAFLGIWTVLAATPIALGLSHQAGALLVFAGALYLAHGCRQGDGIMIPQPKSTDSARVS